TSALNVAGRLTANGINVDDALAITVSGSLVAGGGVRLATGSIDIPGLVGGQTVALFANSGSINETGTLNADTLTGSSASFTNLVGSSFSNRIGTLAGFSSGGPFSLDDGISLTVVGSLSAPSVAIRDNGGLTINGSVTAPAMNLIAGNI